LSIKKNKIWIISIILINLIFVVFLNSYKIENIGFTKSTNKISDTNLSDVESSSTNWYDANWQYRKFINITTSSAAVPSGYTVSLTFDHASLVNLGKSRADGNDIRVAYLSGSDWEELDRMLDPDSSWNRNSTRIWFKTQAAIPAFSSDNNYFLYYGNKFAGLPPTNSSNVFFFYDGFESGDFTAWDGITEGSGDKINIESSITHRGNYAARCYIDDGGMAYVHNNFPALQSFHTTTWFYLPDNYSDAHYTSLIMYYSELSHQVAALNIYEPPDAMKPYIANLMGPGYYFSDQNISVNEWHRLEIKIIISDTSGRAELWVDGVNKVNETNIDTGTEAIVNNNIGIFYRTANETTIFIDDSFDKLWIDPEPTTSLGTETILRASVNDFTYYKVITIDHTKVPGSNDLNNFPILISLFDSDLHDHAQPDGDDIAFHNGSEWLDHEIEIFDQTYNDTHAELIAWVRIPSLSPLIDTNITMYYGNSVIGSQENPTGVWDSNYKGVWHLKEDPSGSQIKDSTSNSLNGISYGSMTSSNQLEGQIGGSLKFDGLNDYIELGSRPELKLTNAFTFEAWYSGIYNGTVNTRSPIFTNGFSYPNIGIRVEAFHSSAGSTNREARVAVGDGSSVNYVISDYEINDNTWTYLVCTYDGSTLKLYINGTQQIDELNTNIAYNTNTATIGSNLNNSEQWYKGLIDELRFLGKNCSAEWIATEYNNQYNPDSFYSVGTENLVNNYLPYENYFTHYKIITVNHTQVAGNGVLLNFPLLLSITDSDLRDKVQADGDDIAFAKDNVWLDHEIELFNFTYSPTESQLIAWVKIPFLSGTKDTQFRMYYGNSTMDSQENPNGIWDTNTFGVWHLSEIGNGASDEYKDNSIYNNNGQGGEGDSLFVPNRTSGMIGFAQDFNNLDGKYDMIDCGDNSIFDISGNQITLQAWIKHNITPQAHFYGIMNHKGWYDGYSLWIEQNSLKLAFNLPGETSQLVSNTDITTNTWHYIVATYDGSYMRIYIDGVQDPNNRTKENNIEPSSSEKDFWIGHGDQPKDVVWSAEYEGQIDEVRVSNIAHTSEWIATEYNNQYSPETFSILSTEHTVSEVPPTSKFFNYYKVITVDYTKVNGSGSHTNFPLLISILDEDLHDHVLSGGNDIAFAIGNEWLDHEIELFNQTYSSTQAQLIAWVRIPSLSTSIDTQITMYYGNSTMESQENPMGVWISGYIGVWHLSEDPTGTIYDSTLNNNDGTTYGSMSSEDQVSGKIDGSLEFDGDDDYIDCGNDNSLDITGDITIEFWVNGVSFFNDLDPDILTKGNYTRAYSTWINDDGGIYFELNHDSLISATKLSLGEWHHVVCVRSGTNRMIYINGSEDISDSFSSAIETITDTLTIARSPDNLNGTLDEVRLSNVARSAEWIATEYNNLYDPANFYSIGIENQIGADTSAPDITINSPNSNELFGLSAPNYNLTVVDANLDSIWYSLDGGTTNSTPVSAIGIIDQTMWDAKFNGTITIRFYANDTIGYLNYKEVTVKKDILSPTISIINPNENDLFGLNAPSYSLSVIDGNLDSIWYSLNGGTSNSTPVSETGIIDQNMWSLRPNGTVIIRFYANDTIGNENYTDVIVQKDIIEPFIYINSPSTGDLFGFNAPNYNLTVLDANLDSIWYTIDSGTTNSTPVSAIGIIDQTMWDTKFNETVKIRFYANDTLGNLNFTEMMVRKDILSPLINIVEPNNYDLFGYSPPDVDLSVIDGNLEKIWYQLYNASITTSNYTWTDVIDQNVWNQIGNGTVTLRFYANDTLGNLANAEVTVYKDIYLPIITIINPKLNEIYNGMAPSFNVSISGSNLDSTWYNLNNGLVNYTFTGLTGYINQSAWTNQLDGIITIKFYINNTLGVLGFDEINIIKDTIDPSIDSIDSPSSNQWFSNILPTYSLSITEVNLDEIWYTLDGGINNYTGALSGTIDSTAWSNAGQGSVTIIFYVNDSVGNWDSTNVIINRDTVNPSMDNINSPSSGSSHSSPPSYSLSITETNLNEIWYTLDGGINNYTGALSGTIDSTAWSNAAQGTVTIIFYVSDFAGNRDSVSVEINKEAASQPSQPPEFPIWIIFVIIGAVAGAVVGIVLIKKSKSKKEFIPQIPEKKLVKETIQEVPEEISQLDYDMLSVMNHNELISREDNLLEHIRHLEENKKYGKAAEVIGELILIEDILGNSQEVKLYRQKQIDLAVRGLEYLKDQYEIESKNAALSGDYSKALELYNESKVISDNLKGYMEHQGSSDTEENIESETMESQPITGEAEIVYSCINDLLTKYFDDIGIKYYSNPQIYEDIQAQVHGLILADQFHLEDIDPLVRERLKSIQIVFTEDMSNATITNLCQAFHNPYVLLIIVGIKWPMNVETQIIEIPPNIRDQNQENTRIIHYELFMTFMGLTGAYEAAFKEIIDLYNKSEIEILQEIQESSEVIIHSTDELRYDLKEKGLIMDKLEEYFNR
jgi:hypothetical protein